MQYVPFLGGSQFSTAGKTKNVLKIKFFVYFEKCKDSTLAHCP